MDTIVVWFSCGAASAVAAKLTLDTYSEYNIRVVNNPIVEEHPDNQRFLKDVESWLGVDIEYARSPKYPDQSCNTVWKDRKYMSGVAGAPCTLYLKKKAREQWERDNEYKYLVLGFTCSEQKRADNFRKVERENLLTPLIDHKLTKEDCFKVIANAGIRLPEMYFLGYPNANCIGCVKATSPTYWNHVRNTNPNVFDERAKLSRELGAKLVRVKGKRVFLDELDPNAKGKPMKSMNFECGIFCEDRIFG